MCVFRIFVCFSRVALYLFPLPLGGKVLRRLVIVALLGPFDYLMARFHSIRMTKDIQEPMKEQ